MAFFGRASFFARRSISICAQAAVTRFNSILYSLQLRSINCGDDSVKMAPLLCSSGIPTPHFRISAILVTTAPFLNGKRLRVLANAICAFFRTELNGCTVNTSKSLSSCS